MTSELPENAKYIMVGICLGLIVILNYSYIFSNVLFHMAFVFGICSVIAYNMVDNKIWGQFFIPIITLAIVCLGLIYLIGWLVNPNLKYTLLRGIIFYIIVTSLVISAMNTSVSTPSFDNFTSEQAGYVTQLMYYIFLYIPCLVVDILKPLRKDYAHTNIITIMLFIVLVAYILWNYIFPLTTIMGDKYLIDKPHKLNQEIINISVNNPIESFVSLSDEDLNKVTVSQTMDVVDRLDEIKLPDATQKSRTVVRQVKELGMNKQLDDNKVKTEHSNYSYAISFWLYLDGQIPSNGKRAQIMSFGKRPSLYYDYVNKVLVVEVASNQPRIYTTPLYQKWNHIVFNYVNGVFDLFINNKLVATESDAVSLIGEDDHIVVGSSLNSDIGSISKFIYFDHALSISKIDQLNKIK